MASEKEISKEQKRHLMQLKLIKENKLDIDFAITIVEAEMDAEDVAYVEKKVQQVK